MIGTELWVMWFRRPHDRQGAHSSAEHSSRETTDENSRDRKVPRQRTMSPAFLLGYIKYKSLGAVAQKLRSQLDHCLYKAARALHHLTVPNQKESLE